MGYDVHITRAAHWVDSEETPITPAEWLALVESDPGLRLDPECGFGEHFATWTVAGVEQTWFNLWRGEVRTKNPKRDTIQKMLEIAAHFGARVQGDEGEVYPTADHWPDRGVRE